jgi:AMMECR1 domain-containing protein
MTLDLHRAGAGASTAAGGDAAAYAAQAIAEAAVNAGLIDNRDPGLLRTEDEDKHSAENAVSNAIQAAGYARRAAPREAEWEAIRVQAELVRDTWPAGA